MHSFKTIKSPILVAMSGGIDSSVVAYMAHDANSESFGVTLLLAPGKQCEEEASNAKNQCSQIGMKHLTIDARSEFEDVVIRNFCESYMRGKTPNPCVECNKVFKLGLLHDTRKSYGAEFLATGHYARRRFNPNTNRWELLKAKDLSKDQSYFLWKTTQDVLAHTIFPLGDTPKTATKEMASQLGFISAQKPESQDVCFVPDGDYLSVVQQWANLQSHTEATDLLMPGDIEDTEGNIIGEHSGLAGYTIGQRKGIGVAASEPLYVIDKDIQRNVLVVGSRHLTFCKIVEGKSANFISTESLFETTRVQAKCRYRQDPAWATVIQAEHDSIKIEFDDLQTIPAKGQSLVLYDGDTVLAGAEILSSS